MYAAGPASAPRAKERVTEGSVSTARGRAIARSAKARANEKLKTPDRRSSAAASRSTGFTAVTARFWASGYRMVMLS